MADMRRPYFPCYGEHLLSDKELRRCPPEAWGVLLALMCISWRGHIVGYLTDSTGKPITNQEIIEHFSTAIMIGATTPDVILAALKKLVDERRVVYDKRLKAYYLPKMVSIGQQQQASRAWGREGGNPQLVKPDRIVVQYAAEYRGALDREARRRVWLKARDVLDALGFEQFKERIR